jgi:hypothetical protein
MERGRAIRLATLPVLLLLAVAAVASLGFLDVRDMVHRSWTEAAKPVVYLAKVPDATSPQQIAMGQLIIYLSDTKTGVDMVGPTARSGGVFSSDLPGARVGWLVGTSLPGALVALAVLALIGAAVGLVRRRGGYARAVVRLLRAVGFAALVGGPVAALVEYVVARQYPELTWVPPVDRWLMALVWVLVGGAFLAVGDLVARAGALRAELDGVI